MSNWLGFSIKTHVANATTNAIYAKVDDGKTTNSKSEFTVKAEVPLPPANLGAEYKQSSETKMMAAGYVKIGAGTYFRFKHGDPHVSIYTSQGEVISDNFNCESNHSVIVTPSGMVNTEMGTIWTDHSGRDWGPR
jgi:hypothetical protein